MIILFFIYIKLSYLDIERLYKFKSKGDNFNIIIVNTRYIR